MEWFRHRYHSIFAFLLILNYAEHAPLEAHLSALAFALGYLVVNEIESNPIHPLQFVILRTRRCIILVTLSMVCQMAYFAMKLDLHRFVYAYLRGTLGPKISEDLGRIGESP
jgi:Kef-type K+ transport system membrane component KefB